MTKSTPERVNILNEAADLIVGQRQEDYGTPEENFQRMADFANIHFKKNLEQNIPFSARQTAEYMILLKMARTVNSPTRDSYVDIAGYAGIAGQLGDNESKAKAATNAAKTATIDSLDVGKLSAHTVTFTANASEGMKSFFIPNASVSEVSE